MDIAIVSVIIEMLPSDLAHMDTTDCDKRRFHSCSKCSTAISNDTESLLTICRTFWAQLCRSARSLSLCEFENIDIETQMHWPHQR